MKPVLLVVDIQNAWLDENKDLKRSVEKRLDAINEAIDWFRSHKRPIIVISHEDRETGTLPGTKPFAFAKSVKIRDSDIRVTKRYPNSFNKTGLEGIVRKLGCDAVVIVGLSASGCVLGTVFGAIDSDITPFLLKGGVASHREDHVRFAEEICDTITLDKLERIAE